MAPPKKSPKKAAAVDANGAANAMDGDIPGESSEVWARIQDNMVTISEHSVFKKIVAALPTGIGGTAGGAFQDAFKLEHYKAAMAGAACKYQCGINIFWLDFSYSAMPGVPLRQRSIDELRDQYFAGPSGFPKTIVIAVDSVQFNPLEHKGSLQRVSPGEIVYALLDAIRRDIDANKDNEYLLEWRRVLLTATGLFELLPSFEDKWWYEHNLREDMATDARNMCRTSYQKICEVLKYRSIVQRSEGMSQCSAAALAERYALKARMSKASEKVTESFIRQAFLVHSDLLALPAALECIQDLEARFGVDSPLNGITKLNAISRVSKDREDVQWVLVSLWELIRRGVYNSQTLTLRDMQATSTGKALLQVFVLKKKMLAYLLAKADSMLSAPVSEKFRQVFANHEAYRQHVRAFPGDPECEVSYQATWTAGARMFLNFIEEAVFKNDYPLAQTFSYCARQNKSVEDVLAYQSFEEMWSFVKDAIDDEKRKAEAQLALVEAAAAATESETKACDRDDPVISGQGGTDTVAADVSVSDGDRVRKSWMAYASQIVNSCIFLKHSPKEADSFAEEIRSSAVTKTNILPGTRNMLIIYDVKLSSEANSRPCSRKAPFREVHFKTCMAATRKVFASACGPLKPGHIIIACDQSKKLASNLVQAFKKNPDDKALPVDIFYKVFFVMLDFDSLVVRKRYGKSKTKVDQLHYLHLLASSDASVPSKRYKSWTGGTSGNVMGPVVFDPVPKTWQMKHAEKKLAYADALRAVGGAGSDSGGEEPAADSAPAVTPETMTPFCWLSYPQSFGDNVLDSLNVYAVLDYTPGDGNLALAALDKKVPYLGFCHSEKHALALHDYLVDKLFQQLTVEGSPWYNVACVAAHKAMGRNGATAAGGPIDDDDKGTKRKKPDGDDKKKKKKKKKNKKKGDKKNKKSSSSSSDPPSGETAESE